MKHVKITEQGTNPGQMEVLESRQGDWVFQGGRYIKIVDVINAPRLRHRDRIIVRFLEKPSMPEKSGKAEFIMTWPEWQQYALEIELKFRDVFPKGSDERRRVKYDCPNFESFTGVRTRLYLVENAS